MLLLFGLVAILTTGCQKYNRQNRNLIQRRPMPRDNQAAAFLVHGQTANYINIDQRGGVGSNSNGVGDRTPNPSGQSSGVGGRGGGSSQCYVGLASVNTFGESYLYNGYPTNGFNTGYQFPVFCDPDSKIHVSRTTMYVSSSTRTMYAVPYDYFSNNAVAGAAIPFDVGFPIGTVASSITGFSVMISQDGRSLAITRESKGQRGAYPRVIKQISARGQGKFIDASWDDLTDDEPRLYLSSESTNGYKIFIIPLSALAKPGQLSMLMSFGQTTSGQFNPAINSYIMPLNPFNANTARGILELNVPARPGKLSSNQGLTVALLQGLGPMAFDFETSLSQNTSGKPTLAVSKMYEWTNRSEPGVSAANTNYIDVAVGVAQGQGQMFLLGEDRIDSFLYYDPTTHEGALENAWASTAPEEKIFSGVQFTSIEMGATNFLTVTTRKQGLFTFVVDDFGNMLANLNWDQPDVAISNIIDASPVPAEAQMPANLYKKEDIQAKNSRSEDDFSLDEEQVTE